MFKKTLYLITSSRSCLKYSTHNNLKSLCKYLNINEEKGKFLQKKNPTIKRLDDKRLINLVQFLDNLGLTRYDLLEEPGIFSVTPLIIKYRYMVLQECGFSQVVTTDIVSYFKIMGQKIKDLKTSKAVNETVNVTKQLENILSHKTKLLINEDEYTLYTLRMTVIQKYLEHVLNLTEDRFYKGLQMYPNIKYRPFQVIKEMIELLQDDILMPNDKIKSNFYLLHGNPENIKQILCNIKTIGGIDIREILRKNPIIMMKNCSNLLEIKSILNEFGMKDGAQKRGVQLFTLSPATVRERLTRAKDVPELSVLFNHPNFLKLIYLNKLILKRIKELNNRGKKCFSVASLYNVNLNTSYMYKQEDKLRSSRDLEFYLKDIFGTQCSSEDILNMMEIYPFWNKIPLAQIKYVYDQLNKKFSSKEIYENCPILFYPWDMIDNILQLFDESSDNVSPKVLINNYKVDVKSLTNSQKLSLTLRYLQNHNVKENEDQKTKTNSKEYDGPDQLLLENTNIT